jgi:hypothetical protein
VAATQLRVSRLSIIGRRWMLRTLEDATTDLFMNVEMKAKAEQADEQKAASN